MHYLLLLLLLSIRFSSAAQLPAELPNALVYGEVKGDNSGLIQLRIDKGFIDNTVVEYSALLEEGRFGIPCRIEVPQLVEIVYDHKQFSFFLEAGDSLKLNLDALDFPKKVGFEGRGAKKNRFLLGFRQDFPDPRNEFQMRYYKKGIFYYRIHQQLDSLMRVLDGEQYVQYQRRQRLKKEGSLSLVQQRDSSALTEAFLAFMDAEIYYDFYYKLLAYSHLYKGRHRLSDEFMYFMDSIPRQNHQAVGNAKYRLFISASINYWQQQHFQEGDPYHQQYYYAKGHLDSLTRYFTMANLVARAFRRGEVESMLPLYEDFLRNNPYVELDKLVVDAYLKADQFAAGKPAPNFSLLDTAGREVRLSDLRGKIVYLDFWASWCRPCMKKLDALKHFSQQFDSEEVVFVHISLDEDQERWKAKVAREGYTGVHLRTAGGSNSVVAQAYGVYSVPEYFLIDAHGRFASTPPVSDLNTLYMSLETLLAGEE